jgi:aspartate racemase
MTERCGIVGGIGPESTMDYYRLITRLYRERRTDGHYPEFSIDNVDLTTVLALLDAGDRATLVDYYLASVGRLASAGCTVAALSSNTSHIVFDEVSARSPIPLVSIVEVAADVAVQRGLRRPALFATAQTVAAQIYQQVFERRGLAILIPSPAEQSYIHEKYMGELVRGIVLPETRSRFVAIANRLHAEGGADSLVLGGTELPLLLRDVPGIDVPVVDTALEHVHRLVELMSA